VGKEPAEIRAEIDKTRNEMGDTVGALGYKADVKSRAKENIVGKRDEVKKGAKRAAGVAQENPLGLALGSVAVGFVAGMLVPSTRIEDEKVGPMADQVKETAKETGQEALERGKEVAKEAAESAKETVQERGPEQAEHLRDSARESVQEQVAR
jgi:hypothetical protein